MGGFSVAVRTGNNKKNWLFGTFRNDEIHGLGGNDKLFGRWGNDTLDGGQGRDRLFGGFGNDDLTGGEGDDYLNGGRGDDLAIYVAADNVDNHDVYDGSKGSDTLRLVLTAEEWLRPEVQADIARFLAASDEEHHSGHGRGHPFWHWGGHKGNETFKFEAFGLIAKNFEKLEITVDGVPLDPADEAVTAVDDALTTDEDMVLNGNVLADNGNGRDDVPDLVAKIELVDGVAGGALVLNEDGSFTYEPQGAYDHLTGSETATETFTYRVTDADGDSDQATVTITVNPINEAPTATASTSSGDEDARSIPVSLRGTDSDGTVISITVTTLPFASEGILYLANGMTPVVANAPVTAAAASNLSFVPGADFNGTATIPFTVTDNEGATSAPGRQVVIVTEVNDPPTLTTFTSVIDTIDEDTEVELTFAELATQGDDADIDGSVNAFIVQDVTSGTLKIGISADTATAFVAGSNDTIDTTNKAYWTPATNANDAALDAFTVKARDNDGALSQTAIQTTVEVTDVNDPPTLTTFVSVIDTIDEDTEVELTFAELAAQGDDADTDGSVNAFVVQDVTSGTLKIGISADTATAFVAGSNDTIDTTNKAYWTPATNANDAALDAFTVKARDNDGALS
ncbi:MAG: hypothetical protein JXQ99_16175, partial [Hyphomicrobiaceae bacterium]